MTIEEVIIEWAASKVEPDFDYAEALKTLTKDKSLPILKNQSINGYLHLDCTIQEFKEKKCVFEGFAEKNIKYMLDIINKYQYYIKMNNELCKVETGHRKKLKKLKDILSDDDFLDFLDNYLYLDKSINNVQGLRIVDNYTGVIKYYLKNNFKFAIEILERFLNTKKIRHDAITVNNTERTNNLILRPKTKAYLKPLGERAYLKCLHFDLLYYFPEMTKKQSLAIIDIFFDITLEEIKTEHSFSKQAISFIKNNHDALFQKVNDYYSVEFEKNIPAHIKEIKNVWTTQTAIEENFKPILTSKPN